MKKGDAALGPFPHHHTPYTPKEQPSEDTPKCVKPVVAKIFNPVFHYALLKGLDIFKELNGSCEDTPYVVRLDQASAFTGKAIHPDDHAFNVNFDSTSGVSAALAKLEISKFHKF